MVVHIPAGEWRCNGDSCSISCGENFRAKWALPTLAERFI